MSKPQFRRPSPDEQHVLDHLALRLVRPQERARYQALMEEHHYLHHHQLVGEQLCYVATYRGQWLALSSWCAAARHLKARDACIGWTPEQCRRRRGLIANNARFLILPDAHYPNLASRVMKLVLQRLCPDWQGRYGHPIVLVESFVDPEQFRGTTYQCSGWSQLGRTQGFGRQSRDYYVAPERPKQLWVKSLIKKAPKKLRAQTLPPDWAPVEDQVPPRCTAQSAGLKALTDHLTQVPEFRSAHSLAYPLAGLLALIAVATFCGVVRGKKELAKFARTLTQSQLRAMRFRADPRSGQIRHPKTTTFFRVLNGVQETALAQALLAWQDQVLGPVQDQLIAVDGKKLKHSQGGELVSAIGAQSGRGLGTVRTPDKTNEITAARTLLERLGQRVELSGKVVVLDALHTHQQTARQIVQDLGADFLFTIKTNQESLRQTVHGLLAAGAFSPSGPGEPCATGGKEPQPAGMPRLAPPTHDARRGVLCGRDADRGIEDDHGDQGPKDRQELGGDYQCRSLALEGQGPAAGTATILGHGRQAASTAGRQFG